VRWSSGILMVKLIEVGCEVCVEMFGLSVGGWRFNFLQSGVRWISIA